MDERVLAAVVAESFRSDLERAGKDSATARGLQLDFDSPTRLLARYARILRAVREQLPPDVKLPVADNERWNFTERVWKYASATKQRGCRLGDTL